MLQSSMLHFTFIFTILFMGQVINNLLLMFNPQRKSKLSDIYMQQRSFQLHLQKMQQIKKSPSPIAPRYDQDPQRKYYEQISLNKLDIKARKSSDIYRENHRLFMKLMETDRQTDLKEAELQPPNTSHPHHNHYYIRRNFEQKVRQENSGLIHRLVNRTSDIPSLVQMKRDFSQSKRYAKMVRKLPAILKHQEQFKRNLSLRRLSESRPTLASSRQMNTQRAPTNEGGEVQPLQQALLDQK